MSHRLEENADTKYQDYKEPKTSRRRLPAKRSEGNQATEGGSQSLDDEAIWDIARRSDGYQKGTRGSFTDKEMSVGNVIEGIEEGSNKRRISDKKKE